MKTDYVTFNIAYFVSFAFIQALYSAEFSLMWSNQNVTYVKYLSILWYMSNSLISCLWTHMWCSGCASLTLSCIVDQLIQTKSL